MKIYTKGGDKGETSLFDGVRISKASIRVEAYGTIDELSSFLGFARSFVENEKLKDDLLNIQKDLFKVGAILATENIEKLKQRIVEDDIIALEKQCDYYMEKAGEFKGFIIPGSNQLSASLHIARTVCRRAERRIITLAEHVKLDDKVLKYVNRLSDTLFAMARFSDEDNLEVKL